MSTEIQREDDSSTFYGLGHHAHKVQVHGHVDADMRYDVEGSGTGSGGSIWPEEERERERALRREYQIEQSVKKLRDDLLEQDPALRDLRSRDPNKAFRLAEERAKKTVAGNPALLIPLEDLRPSNPGAYDDIQRREDELVRTGEEPDRVSANRRAQEEEERGELPARDAAIPDNDSLGDSVSALMRPSSSSKAHRGGGGGTKGKTQTGRVCGECGEAVRGRKCKRCGSDRTVIGYGKTTMGAKPGGGGGGSSGRKGKKPKPKWFCPSCNLEFCPHRPTSRGRPSKEPTVRSVRSEMRMTPENQARMRELGISSSDMLALSLVAYSEHRHLDQVINEWKALQSRPIISTDAA